MQISEELWRVSTTCNKVDDALAVAFKPEINESLIMVRLIGAEDNERSLNATNEPKRA